jgi:hypothetical protein
MSACLTQDQKRLEKHYQRLRTRTPSCVTCGFNRHPAALEYSHIAPRKFHDDGGAQCHNCHSEFSDAERSLPYAPRTANPQMETIGRYLVALAEWFQRIAGTLLGFGEWLLAYAATAPVLEGEVR